VNKGCELRVLANLDNAFVFKDYIILRVSSNRAASRGMACMTEISTESTPRYSSLALLWQQAFFFLVCRIQSSLESPSIDHAASPRCHYIYQIRCLFFRAHNTLPTKWTLPMDSSPFDENVHKTGSNAPGNPLYGSPQPQSKPVNRNLFGNQRVAVCFLFVFADRGK
jgi:hypothetical protein